jgi:2-polyprenyl-6-methoxyphenol hydroxylase-like FAD-dependent oxidoreductase
MAEICIIGAGPVGLGTALILAGDGHDITVLERDEAPPSADPEDAWEHWSRRGVPQARQIHAFIGRPRSILRAELPAILDDLDAAGAARLDFNAPEEDLVGIGARRTTLDLVLLRHAASHPRIEVLMGIGASGLQTGPSARPGTPHITGVHTTAGATVDADLVIDAAGRRSPLAKLLAALGAAAVADDAEQDGFTYWTQWFRLIGTPPPDTALPFAHYTSFSAVRFTADAGWFAICLTGAARDTLLRHLRDQRRFLAVAYTLPPTRDWVDPAVAVPVGPVVPMANIVSRRRRLVRDDVPCANGAVSVGDALACNNPMLGRGVALGLRHAQLLRDTLRDVDADSREFTTEFHQRTDPEVSAWYADTVGWDRSRLAGLAAALRNDGQTQPDPRALFVHAARYDAVLYRAFLRVLGTYQPAHHVFTDPALLARVDHLRPDLPPLPSDPLDRSGLEQLLGN